MEIIGTQRTTPREALDVLQELGDEEDLNREQKICLEFLRKHLKIEDKKTIEELKKEIEGVANLKDHHIDKIIEILPKSEQEVRALFSKERVRLSDEDVEKIVEISESVSE